jgi:transposase
LHAAIVCRSLALHTKILTLPSDELVSFIRGKQAKAVIPPRRHRPHCRRYDRAAYRDRNRIERFFCRLKQFRRVATRYDKLLERYTSFVALSASVVWLNA